MTMSDQETNEGPIPKQKEFVEFLEQASNQRKEEDKRPWKVWFIHN
tara:strand:- start:453 stop:590 length:138 start_codon:yes stop_codon:yes gene_type:complete